MKLAERLERDEPPGNAPRTERTPAGVVIGQLLRQAGRISESDIQRIIAYQGRKRLRFGEAALGLRLVEPSDVLEALSLQFQYPYARAQTEAFRDSELFAVSNPFGAQAEALRALRSQLLGLLSRQPRAVLAVVSPDVDDGKTYVAANLAATFSQLGARTLLIDADLRRPRQHRLFGTDSSGGLSMILADRSQPEVVQPIRQLTSLRLLPAGPVPPNPLELLERPRFASLLADMAGQFDYVVLDTAAASRGIDASVVAANSGAVLMIGRKDRTRMAALDALLRSLARISVAITGVLINEH